LNLSSTYKIAQLEATSSLHEIEKTLEELTHLETTCPDAFGTSLKHQMGEKTKENMREIDGNVGCFIKYVMVHMMMKFDENWQIKLYKWQMSHHEPPEAAPSGFP
jgi:hypothetical protein